jgi:hypothetical protein
MLINGEPPTSKLFYTADKIRDARDEKKKGGISESLSQGLKVGHKGSSLKAIKRPWC